MTDTWRIPPVIWRALDQLGVPSRALSQEAGFSENVATDPAAEFTTAQIFGFWKAAERRSGDPLLGFRMLKAAAAVGSDSTFLAATRARTFGAALESYIASRRLHSPVIIEKRQFGPVVRFERRIPRAVEPEPSIAVDFTLGTLLSLGRVGLGSPVTPRYVELARTDPALAFHGEFYGCTIRYGSSRNAIAFDEADLDRSHLSHDPEVAQALQAAIVSLIEKRGTVADVGLQAKEVLLKYQRADRVNLEAVARELGLSARSFQRKLKERGVTFRAIVEDVRLQPSLALLEQSRLTIGSIAHRLGYGDAATFSRAFKAWSGMSPREWRGVAARPPSTR